MKRAFVLVEGWHLASAMVPKETADILRVGDKVMASQPIDYGFEAAIKRGELGVVDHIYPDTGGVEILLERSYQGLSEWRNHILIEPFTTEDILGNIVVCCMLCVETLQRIA